MKRTIVILILLTVFLICKAFATGGGPQSIRVLGYDPDDKKIYFTYNFEDEFSHPIYLLVYSISDGTLCEAQLEGSKDDLDIQIKFNKEIVNFQKKLKPLDQDKSREINIMNRTAITGTFYPDPKDFKPIEVSYFKEEVSVFKGKDRQYKFDLDCFTTSECKIVNVLETPDKAVKVGIIRYKGNRIEDGYDKEYLMFVPQETKRVYETWKTIPK